MLPDFFIGWNDFFYFKRIGKNGNWANRLRLGLSTNDETPFAPFSVDNNLNIRGVGNTIDRGTGVIVVNTEYRHTLYEKNWFVLQGNAFIDAGTWRNPGGDFGDFSKDDNIKVYPGLGLRFIHKKIYNAIFRIDYGVGVTPNSSKGFVFGIGQYF
jgi:mannose-6-phosphate isomerase-like protein (cupin superfamily)